MYNTIHLSFFVYKQYMNGERERERERERCRAFEHCHLHSMGALHTSCHFFTSISIDSKKKKIQQRKQKLKANYTGP
jgi:hypothetical protein